MSKVQLYARDGYPYHKATQKEILSAIKVKALEWEGSEAYGIVIGLYGDRFKTAYELHYSYSGECWEQILGRDPKTGMITALINSTLTDAQAACQAHHEQHVLSMIETEETT